MLSEGENALQVASVRKTGHRLPLLPSQWISQNSFSEGVFTFLTESGDPRELPVAYGKHLRDHLEQYKAAKAFLDQSVITWLRSLFRLPTRSRTFWIGYSTTQAKLVSGIRQRISNNRKHVIQQTPRHVCPPNLYWLRMPSASAVSVMVAALVAKRHVRGDVNQAVVIGFSLSSLTKSSIQYAGCTGPTK